MRPSFKGLNVLYVIPHQQPPTRCLGTSRVRELVTLRATPLHFSFCILLKFFLRTSAHRVSVNSTSGS